MATIKYDRTPPAPPSRDIDEDVIHFAVVMESTFLGAFPTLPLAQNFVEDRAIRAGISEGFYSIYPIIEED